mmetsp:Transcript_37107/g.37783  ORF Transcript_37107/g.37783 Transcript_37107/m.37783 type:complete len:202 (+) Transcript_37107:166-771(+)|eukprot:CAMPEP_0182417150 /NCGR_PEP_ID=MMETSP1167-20130531/1556_1 /TAXON_ID=2988 /ORGANISM="Mallomonas Sp, Strain CCMP3275" /LENGTH=201 /DNA_ID=CAMNT_0024590483 /DNA_START=70 /DNA_END=675 /DNA_ORIENTATION=-
MSGSGRKSGYRKKITDEFLHSDIDPADGEDIVRIKCSRGTNIFEIENRYGDVELAMMPNKFKKLIWIKRGDFVILSSDSDTSGDSSSKVRFMIKNILNKDQIKNIKRIGKWPIEFSDDTDITKHPSPGEDSPCLLVSSDGNPSSLIEPDQNSTSRYRSGEEVITDYIDMDDSYNNNKEEEEEEDQPVDAFGNTILASEVER